MAPEVRPDPERVAVGFVRALRQRDVDVPAGRTITFARALSAVGISRSSTLYWAGRATLLGRPEDIPAYDEAFAAYWLGQPVPRAAERERQETVAVDDPSVSGDGEEPADAAESTVVVRYSPQEALRHKDFATCSPTELAEAYRLIAGLRLTGAVRRSRRHRRSSRQRGRPDLRHTVRRAMRTGGVPLRPAYLERDTQQRRVVLLCDVSGSMDTYARALVRFLHTAVVGRRRVEAFAIGTRLTRLTRALTTRDPDAALTAAAAAVADWSGGTRLGENLRRFNDLWGIRGMARGAVIVILSDGWDRGDPAVLAAQLERLRRVAHRIVWLNPLKAAPGYAPLTRGMAAALPYLDDFLEGHSVASLEVLADILAE